MTAEIETTEAHLGFHDQILRPLVDGTTTREIERILARARPVDVCDRLISGVVDPRRRACLAEPPPSGPVIPAAVNGLTSKRLVDQTISEADLAT
jgi:hypothetical protein